MRNHNETSAIKHIQHQLGSLANIKLDGDKHLPAKTMQKLLIT